MPDVKSEKQVVELELDMSPAPDYRDDQIVKSVDEGDDILDYMASNPGPHYPTDLAKRFDLKKDKVVRILHTFHSKMRVAPFHGVENGWGVTDKGRELALRYSGKMSRLSQKAMRQSTQYEPVS